MVEQGYSIGFPELYVEVRQLGEKLTEYMNRQNVISAGQDHRINELVKDLEDMRSRLETEKEQRAGLAKQFWFSLLSSLVLPVVVMVVGGLIIAKGS